VGWIAAISYSLYLSHKIAFHLVQEAIVPSIQGSGGLQFATYALATLLLGAVLHYLVERPFLRWRDRRTTTSRFNAEAALRTTTAITVCTQRGCGTPTTSDAGGSW
jgi:peptidoglycan/LPS O-acetylase OafA/YrhL